MLPFEIAATMPNAVLKRLAVVVGDVGGSCDASAVLLRAKENARRRSAILGENEKNL
jgi:hypothetical protein